MVRPAVLPCRTERLDITNPPIGGRPFFAAAAPPRNVGTGGRSEMSRDTEIRAPRMIGGLMVRDGAPGRLAVVEENAPGHSCTARRRRVRAPTPGLGSGHLVLTCTNSRHNVSWGHATASDPGIVDGRGSRHAVAVGAIGNHGTAARLAGAHHSGRGGRRGVGGHRRPAGAAPRHGEQVADALCRARSGRLQDAPRPGPRRYDEETEQRILDVVSQSPPDGHATWTGTRVAEALGDVSDHHVWQVLRQHSSTS